ncbi:MAG: hypothetical protein MJ193_03790, partial [Clostridia bacterium]|nr:hypothetical protein [Clostridia bacterium]
IENLAPGNTTLFTRGLGNMFEAIPNISRLIASILPLPFASEAACNPSANIYIDLNPKNSDYNLVNNQTMHKGIQAIELFINCKKGGAGTTMDFYKYGGSSYKAGNLYKSTGGTGFTGTVWTPANDSTLKKQGSLSAPHTDAFDYLALRITPLGNAPDYASVQDALLGFAEAESYSAFEGQVGAPTSITITDPGTRAGSTNTGKSIILNETYLENPAYFPQKVNVNWLNGMDSTGNTDPESLDHLGGTYIVWDASSVNMTAASKDSTGQYLAGYVYGYVLNLVAYAIPVYITNGSAFTGIKEYYNDGGSYVARKIAIDMQSDEAKLDLPDLVRISTISNGTKTFATALTMKDGSVAQAMVNTKIPNAYIPYVYWAEIDAKTALAIFNETNRLVSVYELHNGNYVRATTVVTDTPDGEEPIRYFIPDMKPVNAYLAGVTWTVIDAATAEAKFNDAEYLYNIYAQRNGKYVVATTFVEGNTYYVPATTSVADEEGNTSEY